jgi:hypothetical protein
VASPRRSAWPAEGARRGETRNGTLTAGCCGTRRLHCFACATGEVRPSPSDSSGAHANPTAALARLPEPKWGSCPHFMLRIPYQHMRYTCAAHAHRDERTCGGSAQSEAGACRSVTGTNCDPRDRNRMFRCPPGEIQVPLVAPLGAGESLSEQGMNLCSLSGCDTQSSLAQGTMSYRHWPACARDVWWTRMVGPVGPCRDRDSWTLRGRLLRAFSADWGIIRARANAAIFDPSSSGARR